MLVSARQRLASAALALVAAAAGCGGGDNAPDSPTGSARPVTSDPGPVHVHGLGVNPEDGALFIATHTGLFRAGPDERRSRRVADRYQDTMGFTVVGPNRFLGSGHPDLRERRPPFLGLIESRDAGRTWRQVSLLGKRDFHVLESHGRRVYGYGSDFDTREQALLVSGDGGRTWQQRATPEPVLALAIDPLDADRIVASGERRMHVSIDAGRTWRAIEGAASLVVWLQPGGLFAVDGTGAVRRSDAPGRPWRTVGDIGGPLAAFEASGYELYAALHDGTVKRSSDDGASWSVRATP